MRCLMLALLACAPSARADEAALLPHDTRWFLSVRPGASETALAVAAPFRDQALVPLDGVERLVLFPFLNWRPPLLIVRTAKAFDAAALRQGMQEVKASGKAFWKGAGRAVWIANERTFVVGDPWALTELLAVAGKDAKAHPLAAELAAAHPVSFAIRPAFIVRAEDAERRSRRGKAEMKPLDEALEGGEERWERPVPLWQRPFLRCDSLLVTLSKDGEAEAVASFADSADRTALARMALLAARDLAPRFFRSIEAEGKSDVLKAADALLRGAKLAAIGKRIKVTAKGTLPAKALASLLEAEALVRKEAGQLSRLVLAIHEGHDETKAIPGDLADKDGKKLLSWRVALLPWLGHKKLFDEFKKDEPWDSAHNKELLARMPAVYAPVKGKAEKGMTPYQMFTGARTLWDMRGGKPDFRRIKDGLSNTVAVVEGSSSVPWTKPADLVVELGVPLPKCGGHFKGFFNAAFLDGSVHRLRRDFDDILMRLAICPNDSLPFSHADLYPDK
ncbi:MAG: DUF1559 domain-containing protein [Gemmataceae bacterium]|nr:DUF1559 domain-containing protein [Gemmataceae bacterium]